MAKKAKIQPAHTNVLDVPSVQEAITAAVVAAEDKAGEPTAQERAAAAWKEYLDVAARQDGDDTIFMSMRALELLDEAEKIRGELANRAMDITPKDVSGNIPVCVYALSTGEAYMAKEGTVTQPTTGVVRVGKFDIDSLKPAPQHKDQAHRFSI